MHASVTTQRVRCLAGDTGRAIPRFYLAASASIAAEPELSRPSWHGAGSGGMVRFSSASVSQSGSLCAKDAPRWQEEA
jgi:hypothetical protein